MSRSAAAIAATAPAPSTRETILDAAERGFADRGYAAASMREIAAAAGLRNQASIYHHFADKRALYEATLARGVDAIVAFVRLGERDLRRESGTAGRAAAVDATLDRVFDYLVAHPQLARLIQRASVDDSAVMREALAQMFRPLFAQGLRALTGAEGLWRPSELPHLAAGLYHLIFGYFGSAPLLHAVLGEDPLNPQAIARQRRFVKTAVRALLGVAVSPRARVTEITAQAPRRKG